MSTKLQKDPRRLRLTEDTSPTCRGYIVCSPRCFLAPGVQRHLSRTRDDLHAVLTTPATCAALPRASRTTDGFRVGNPEDTTLLSRSPRGHRNPPCLVQSGGSLRGGLRFPSGPPRKEDPQQEADKRQRAAEPWGGIVPHAAQHWGVWIICGNQRREK